MPNSQVRAASWAWAGSLVHLLYLTFSNKNKYPVTHTFIEISKLNIYCVRVLISIVFISGNI